MKGRARAKNKRTAPLLGGLKRGPVYVGELTLLPHTPPVNPRTMEKAVELLLEGMGVDVSDPNYVETPRRVARMYEEFLRPKPHGWSTFPAKSADLVLLRGHKAIGLCPHHLQPVEYTCYVGYIPAERTVGLSKLARVVDAQLTTPLLHEDLAARVADALVKELKPVGAGVVLSGIHGCMRFRGVRSPGDVVVSAMRGTLLANSSARAEFMQMVGRP